MLRHGYNCMVIIVLSGDKTGRTCQGPFRLYFVWSTEIRWF